jgi:steroid delta-isomerase-like uncharacterized protein
MTSSQALALLTQYYAAFNAERDDDLLAQLSADVIHDINQGGRELGKAAFSAFLERMRRCYKEEITELAYCVSDDGLRGAVEYVVLGTYLQTDDGLPPARGQRYRLAGGAFFAMAGGVITRVTNYYNLQEWLTQIEA